jgi:hypothetical protein
MTMEKCESYNKWDAFLRSALTRRTAVYGPVRTVVWEGLKSPYPDHQKILLTERCKIDFKMDCFTKTI